MAKIGRPKKITGELIQKLEQGFLMGLNDIEACLYVNIAPATLWAFCKANPDFLNRKEVLKDHVKMQAKMNIAGGIKAGDKPLSQWYLERKDRDFNPKTQSEVTGNITINVIDEFNDQTPV